MMTGHLHLSLTSLQSRDASLNSHCLIPMLKLKLTFFKDALSLPHPQREGILMHKQPNEQKHLTRTEQNNQINQQQKHYKVLQQQNQHQLLMTRRKGDEDIKSLLVRHNKGPKNKSSSNNNLLLLLPEERTFYPSSSLFPVAKCQPLPLLSCNCQMCTSEGGSWFFGVKSTQSGPSFRPPLKGWPFRQAEQEKEQQVAKRTACDVCILFKLLLFVALTVKCVAGKDLILREKSSPDEEILAFLIGFVLFVSIFIIGSILSKCLWSRPFKYNRNQGKLLNEKTQCDCDDRGASTGYGSMGKSGQCSHSPGPRVTTAAITCPSSTRPLKVTTSFLHARPEECSIGGKIKKSTRHLMSHFTSFCVNLVPWDLVEDDDDDDDAEDGDDAITPADSDDAAVEEDDENHHHPHHQSQCDHQQSHHPSHEETESHQMPNSAASESISVAQKIMTNSSLIHQNIFNCNCASSKDIKWHESPFAQTPERLVESLPPPSHPSHPHPHPPAASCNDEAKTRGHGQSDQKQVNGSSVRHPASSEWANGPSECATVHLKHLQLKIAKPCQFQQVSYL